MTDLERRLARCVDEEVGLATVDVQLIRDALAELGRLREALEAVEWVGDGYADRCPWCGGHDIPDSPLGGHRADCPRQAALQAGGAHAD